MKKFLIALGLATFVMGVSATAVADEVVTRTDKTVVVHHNNYNHHRHYTRKHCYHNRYHHYVCHYYH
jgi:ribosomal protein S17